MTQSIFPVDNIPKQEVAAFLWQLSISSPVLNKNFGICGNLSQHFKITYTAIENLFELYGQEWPHFTGNLKYPIPASSKRTILPTGDHERVYIKRFRYGTLWTGTQGYLRRSFCRFLYHRLMGEFTNAD